jgi:hypothetical protein
MLKLGTPVREGYLAVYLLPLESSLKDVLSLDAPSLDKHY